MDLNIGQIFFLVWCGVLSNFTKGYFMYDIQTVQLLCETQCSALCVDQNTGPNCGGTCAVRSRYFVESLLPDLPQLYPPMVKGHEIGLQWVQNLTPHNTVLYVVQTKQQGIQQSWNNTSWNNTAYELRITKYTIEVPDVCSNYYFRVMSINQYGSKGFSEWATVSRQAFKPGKVENVQSVRGIVEDSGIYYHPNSKEFMAIIRWDDVKNFQRDEIHYEWETMSRMNCNASLMKEPMVNVLPIIEQINLNDSNPNHFRMLIRVAEDAYGCSYQTGVRAVTSCGIKGPITNFKFDLSDCSRINNYSCNLVNKPFRQPGPASNVSTCAVYSQPYVHLRLTWQPPEDLGSKGIVDHYIIIWGFVAINPFPMPPSFLGTPNITRVESGVRMIEIGVEYSYLPAVYGFQLIPVAPGQNGTENNYLFEIHTISIDNNNNPMNPHRMMGKVILQCNDVKVVQIANTLDVDVSWQPLSRKLIPSQPSSHECHDSYSLRWGSLSNLGQMMSQNTEIATDNENETSIILHIEDPKPVYGFKLIGICEDDMEEDIESKWKIATLHTFRVEEVEISNTTAVPDTADGNSSKASLTLAVVCGVIIPIVLILGICFFKRKQAAKRKLQNLSVINRSLLNFNHYYKVNPLSSPDTLPSTVVADAWELPHSGVRAGRVLGKGAFGLVFKGLVCKGLLLNRSTILPNNLVTEGNDVPVAIKILLDSAGESFRKDFLREINLMKKIGYHENVVSMLGCCTLCDPICLIVEHVPFGDLLSYLKNIRQKMLKQDHTQNPYVNNEDDGLSPSDLLSFAMQIAIGMEFLSSKGFIHRDLAARNVLVGHHKTVKIGDFGLTRYIYNDAIYINRKGGKLPLKWMSIEAIFELTFSQASDVWSFGIVLFEIVTLGGTPYPTVDPHDLLGVLRSGYRMEKPENCSHELYQLMLDCWRTSPQDRPSFADLKNTLQDMLTKHMPSDFLDVRLNKNNIYYTVSSPDVSEQVSMESTDAERVTEASDTMVIQPYRTKYADETETSCNSILNDNLVLNGEYFEAKSSDCSDCVVTYKKSINLPVDNDKKLRSNKEISEKHDITANKPISTCQQKNYWCTNDVVSVPSINDNIETIGGNYETSDSENEGDNVCSTFAIVECDVHCDSNQDTPSVERLMHTDSGMFENPDECTSLFEATRLCICRIHRTQRDSGIDGASISNAGMSPKNSPISSHGNHKESSGPEDEVFLAEEMTVDAGNSKHARQFSGSENRCLVCGGILGGSFESSLEDEDDANKTVLACQEMSTSSNIRNITSQTAHKKHMYSSSSEDVDIGKVDDCYLNGLPSIIELETRDTKF